jgi:protein-arginine kinase activator protein McsA
MDSAALLSRGIEHFLAEVIVTFMPRSAMAQKRLQENAYAGLTTCLRCDEHFESWDRRQNRLCASCLEYLNQQPSDEDQYIPLKRRYLPRAD